MTNILLTYRCNLHCSYCFANEFVNKENKDITISNFLKAVSFITKNETADIGLIGGEPTLHPGFREIMELLIANQRVSQISLFTNGLLLDRFILQITHPKVRILVNCNSPEVIGEKAFSGIKQNLDTLIMQYGMKDRVRLSINLYSDDMDYAYIMELLQRYQLHRLRFSLTVPDFSSRIEDDQLEYFQKRKPFLLEFYRKMDSIKVLPYSDCNHTPYCIWTDKEKEWLEDYVSRYPEINSNLISHCSRCFPAVDILPSLHAIRCFGMSDYLKVPITDFRDIPDLTAFFQNEIDSNAYKLSANEKCKNCYERKVRNCVPGCMGYKAARIRACNEAIKKL